MVVSEVGLQEGDMKSIVVDVVDRGIVLELVLMLFAIDVEGEGTLAETVESIWMIEAATTTNSVVAQPSKLRGRLELSMRSLFWRQ